jgi:hypothetical protein
MRERGRPGKIGLQGKQIRELGGGYQSCKFFTFSLSGFSVGGGDSNFTLNFRLQLSSPR